jgi:hypothetical protein
MVGGDWLNTASFAVPAKAGRLLLGDRLLRLLAIVPLLAALSAGTTSALLVILAERHQCTGPGPLRAAAIAHLLPCHAARRPPARPMSWIACQAVRSR